jgi:hypothetical protein
VGADELAQAVDVERSSSRWSPAWGWTSPGTTALAGDPCRIKCMPGSEIDDISQAMGTARELACAETAWTFAPRCIIGARSPPIVGLRTCAPSMTCPSRGPRTLAAFLVEKGQPGGPRVARSSPSDCRRPPGRPRSGTVWRSGCHPATVGPTLGRRHRLPSGARIGDTPRRCPKTVNSL